MNSRRQEFLNSLKVTNTNSNRKGNRYKSDIKAKEMAKKPSVLKKVAALFMTGSIATLGVANIDKYFDNSDLQHNTNQPQIQMVNESKANIPAELYLPRKAQYDQLQKDIAEYKKLDSVIFKDANEKKRFAELQSNLTKQELDSVIFKDANEKKRFAELQSNLTKQEKVMHDFSLDLIKYRVAQDFGIENYSDLVIKPGFDDGKAAHRIVNKRTQETLYYDQLNEPTLDAITNITNYQSIRNKCLPYDSIPQTEKDARISKLVVQLNDNMVKFNKDMLKIFYPKDNASKQVAMKKDDGMER